MKTIVGLNRSGKLGQGTTPTIPTEPAGLEIQFSNLPLAKYHAFMVAVHSDGQGVASLINPTRYFGSPQPTDVHVLLCGDPSSLYGGNTSVYPVLFIARVVGMSKPRNYEGRDNCCTVCVDVTQRAGVCPPLSLMRTRQLINLCFHSARADDGSSTIILRPSYSSFVEQLTGEGDYRDHLLPVVWEGAVNNTPVCKVTSSDGTTVHGPYKTFCMDMLSDKLTLARTAGSLNLREDWAVWACRSYIQSKLDLEYFATWQYPAAALSEVVANAGEYAWCALRATWAADDLLLPCFYRESSGLISEELTGEGLTVLIPGPLQYT